MISALTVSLNKIIKEDDTGDSWMVLSTCTGPSTELVNMETGETCHVGDQGMTAARFAQTDDDLHEGERHKAFELMHKRRKRGHHVDAGRIDIDELKDVSISGAVIHKNTYTHIEKPMASVHKLHVVQKAGVLDDIKDVSDDPGREYLDMIAEELISLTDLCVKGELRGIAIAYVMMDEDEMITSNHNFITDGRGIASLNAGIDLVKDYIAEAMRERFGAKKGE